MFLFFVHFRSLLFFLLSAYPFFFFFFFFFFTQVTNNNIQFHCDRPFSDLVFWFDVTFPSSSSENDESNKGGIEENERHEGGIILSTSPLHPPTHWQHGVVHLPTLMGPENNVKFVTPQLMISMNQDIVNSRNYVIGVEMAEE